MEFTNPITATQLLIIKQKTAEQQMQAKSSLTLIGSVAGFLKAFIFLWIQILLKYLFGIQLPQNNCQNQRKNCILDRKTLCHAGKMQGNFFLIFLNSYWLAFPAVVPVFLFLGMRPEHEWNFSSVRGSGTNHPCIMRAHYIWHRKFQVVTTHRPDRAI